MDAALAGDDELSEALGLPVVAGWATFAGALEATRGRLERDPDASAWGTRLIVAGEPPELVGWGGFKGPPLDGTVELGYEIAESRWGRGLATAVGGADARRGARRRRAWPGSSPTPCAEPNASNRVLEKTGFTFDGETREGEKPVWRFARAGSA